MGKNSRFRSYSEMVSWEQGAMMKHSLQTALLVAVLWMAASAPLIAQAVTYSLLGSGGTQPSPRFDGTVAYDPSGRRLFLFGGQDAAPRNDLWVYSLARRSWEEAAVTGERPPARFGHTMIFDPLRQRLVVFGGQAGAGFFSDVWVFSIAGGAWEQVSPSDSGPSRRYGHSAIYDSARDRMVVSHGFTNAGRFDDTWAFNLATNAWQNLTPSGTRPLRRCLHHAVYDAANNRMLLYGGCASGFGPCPLADLWSFDLNTNRWVELDSPERPPARQHYGMTFDTVHNRLILFGGSGNELLNDTWFYDVPSGQWRAATVEGTLPNPRSRLESAYASDRGQTFFFGGLTDNGLSNELWMLSPAFISTGPQLAAEGVVNAFSNLGGEVSPGEIITIYGSNLGPLEGVAFGFDPVTGELPRSGPGVSVTWNEIPAPFYFARTDQLNVGVPYELQDATEARLRVTVNGQANEAVTVPVVPTHPGLFPAIWNEDGTVNSPDNPAPVGSIIVLYATGQGVTIPASRTGAFPNPNAGTYPAPLGQTTLRIGGLAAELLFAGQAPGTAGTMQINARVPFGVVPGSSVPVVLQVGAAESRNEVTLHTR